MAGPVLTVTALIGAMVVGFAPQNAPTAVRSNTVYVSVLGESGVPVTDLTAPDFAIKEDGQPREILRVDVASEPMQMMILVDDNGTGLFRSGLIQFVQQFQGLGQIAVSTVTGQTQKLVDYTANVDTVAQAIATLSARPATNDGGQLLEGIFQASKDQEKRGASRPVIVALTVGGEEHSTVPAHQVLDQLAKSRSVLLPRDVTLTRISGGPDPHQASARPDALISKATSTRAEMRALQQLGERATLEADAARRARLPSPNVFGGMKRADDASGRETGGVFGLSVSLPLFDTGGREAARWAAERARVDAERASIEFRIRSEIVGASEVLALRQAALAQEQQGAAEELAQIAGVAYREGEVGILELLDAVRTASRARVRSIDLRLEARLAQIALERAVGDTLWP